MVHGITILIGGAAGQGIQTIGSLLTNVCHKSGIFVFSHAVKKAVMPADNFQVPAFVPMDQYLVNSAMKAPREFDLGDAHKPFLQTDPVTKEAQVSQGETYQRYRLTKNGISFRIPLCTGAGLVRVAGNEYTEAGSLDEDFRRLDIPAGKKVSPQHLVPLRNRPLVVYHFDTDAITATAI